MATVCTYVFFSHNTHCIRIFLGKHSVIEYTLVLLINAFDHFLAWMRKVYHTFHSNFQTVVRKLSKKRLLLHSFEFVTCLGTHCN